MTLRRITPIIVHLAGAAAAAIVVIIVCLHQLFRLPDGHVLGWRQFLSPKNLIGILSYRTNPFITCPISIEADPPLPPLAANLPSAHAIAPLFQENAVLVAAKPNDHWTIYKASAESLTPLVENIVFPGNTLTKSYLPVSTWVVYPDCRKKTCTLEQLNVGNRDTKSIPAIGEHEGVAEEGVGNLFYDESKKLIAYTTKSPDISNRVVINFDGKLIQSIDESPGINRQLRFLTYMPESGMMVYEDSKTQDRFYYAVDHIALWHNYCRP